MATFEFEKTAGNQVRIKSSDWETSKFYSNNANVQVYASGKDGSGDNIAIVGKDFSIRCNVADITTINGIAAPATVEEVLAIIADEVFINGGYSGGDGAVESITGNLVNGTDAITGFDYYVDEHTALLNNGTGDLKAIYDRGDGIHVNNAGREDVIAPVWKQKLTDIGMYN